MGIRLWKTVDKWGITFRTARFSSAGRIFRGLYPGLGPRFINPFSHIFPKKSSIDFAACPKIRYPHNPQLHNSQPVEKRIQRPQGEYAKGEKDMPGFSTKKGELSTEIFYILSN